jgi:methyl-accepting chemotaxis protein
MASLSRSRSVVNCKTNEFLQKSDEIRSEINDRTILIRNTELTITMMIELINMLNQLNNEHSQDLAIIKTDFDKKFQDFNDISQTIKHNWDIKKEIEQISLLENEKIQVQKELYEQTSLLERFKTVLGKAIIS